MGNRAVITTLGEKRGIYLHWNGGRDSIEPIISYAYNFLTDESEFDAIKDVAKFFGLNPFVDDIQRLDCNNYDNGVYIVDNGEIVGRCYFDRKEQQEYDFDEFMYSLNDAMPKCYKKDKDWLLRWLASSPLKDKWGIPFYKDMIKEGYLKEGDIILYNKEWKKIVRSGTLDNLPLIVDLNTKSNYKIEDLEHSYYGKLHLSSKYEGRLEYEVRVLNKNKYEELLEKSKTWDKSE